MTAKEYLEQIAQLEHKITIEKIKIQKLESEINYKSPKLDGTSGNCSSCDTLGSAVAKLADMKMGLETLTTEYFNKWLEVEQTIKTVEDVVKQEILTRKYLDGQSWNGYNVERKNPQTGRFETIHINGIHESMNYSSDRIFALHRQALDEIILPENATVKNSEKQ